MNAKTARSLILLLAGSVCTLGAPLYCQADEPQAERQCAEPAVLAAAMAYSKDPKPVIFNIGSAQQIKGAILIGPVGKKENLEKFRQKLASLPKDKEIIVYCGCCPLPRCPNAAPACELLKDMKFTKAKLLKLTSSLKDDWTSKGYPVE